MSKVVEGSKKITACRFPACRTTRSLEGFYEGLKAGTGLDIVPISAYGYPVGTECEIVYRYGTVTGVRVIDNGKSRWLNLPHVDGVPAVIDNSAEVLSVHGVLTLHTSVHQRLIQERPEYRKLPYGEAVHLYAQTGTPVGLTFVPMGVDSHGMYMFTHNTVRTTNLWLMKMGFSNATIRPVKYSVDPILNVVDQIIKGSKNLPYPLEGVVVAAESHYHRTLMGEADGVPLGGVIYRNKKNDPYQVTDIIHQVNSDGTLYPVIALKVSVRRKIYVETTYDHIYQLGVAVGDMVSLVEDRGGNMMLSSVQKCKGGSMVTIPENCPSCNSEVVHGKCTGHYGCPEQLSEILWNMCSKDALCVPLIKRDLIDLLCTSGIVKSPLDFFNIEVNDGTLPVFIKAGYSSHIAAISSVLSLRDAMYTSFNRAIMCLGIEGLTPKHARAIARETVGLTDLWTRPGECIPSDIRDKVVSWFSRPNNMAFALSLQKYANSNDRGLIWSTDIDIYRNYHCDGLTFYVNKNSYLASIYKMDELRLLVSALGGKLTNRFTTAVDVVLGDNVDEPRTHTFEQWDDIDVSGFMSVH